MRLLSGIFVLLLLVASGSVLAEVHVSPFEGWRTLHSERFSVQYAPSNRELAEKALAIAEQSLPQIEQFLRWKVSTHIYINVIDQQDAANGWATMLPYNHVTLFTTPPTQFSELGDYNRWMRLLIAHELTHIVHLDKGGGGPLAVRHVLGRFPLLFPNAYQPNLFTEGLATWMETDRANGFGRGQSAYFAMMMRTEVASGLLSLGEVQQYRSEWPLNHSYLYGVHFFRFLETVYGKNRIPEYIDGYSTNIIPFLLSTSSERIANKSIRSLWRDYLAWLEQQYRPQITAITAAGTTPATRITQRGYITGRPVAFGQQQLAWVDVGLDQPSWIVLRGSDGVTQRLTRAQSDARLIGVVGSDLLYLQEVPCGERKMFSELFRVSVDATSPTLASALGNGLAMDRAEQLTHCGRYTHGSVSADGKSIALVQSLTGVQQLVVRTMAGDFKSETTDAEVIWRGGYDEQVAQPAWLDEHTLVVSLKRADEKWQLYRVDLRDKALKNRSLQKLPLALARGNQQTPFFDAAAGLLYFTADHTGVFEIYRCDRNGSSVARVTRSLTGSADPWVAYGKVFHIGYTPEGWDVFSASADTTVADDAPLPANATAGSTGMQFEWKAEDTLDAGAGLIRDRRYTGLPSMLPRSWFLAGFSSGDAQEIGLTTNGNDALYFHQYMAGIAHESGVGKNSGLIQYIAYNHVLLGYQRSYDVVGNGVAPAEDGFIVDEFTTRDDTLAAAFWTLPMNFSSVTWYAGLNDSRDNVHNLRPGALVTQHHYGVSSTGGGFIYESSQKFLHGISESHGRRVKVGLEHDELDVRDLFASGAIGTNRIQGEVFSLDWREYLPLGGSHVLALRAFSGRADDGADYFQLGGELSVLQFTAPYVHQRRVGLRGYSSSLPELTDRNADAFSAEWRMPLFAVNRGVSGFPVGAHDASATLFYDAGRVWGTAPNPLRRQDAKLFDSAGAEAAMLIDLGFSMLPLQLRLGYARALVDDPRVSRNTVYIRMGTSF